ncbi:P2X purinoceptor 3 [Liparis tanakae]|uniref:P2X purinoceptor 3 n=1 Tax=Liparis tanakae TaxID=230148 RepID=A0A4Z2ELD0_9TELE|nr:P2X purinoceptor 3 [Liparis tanakae]
MTKVKGYGDLNGQVMDVADYVFPQQGAGIFCIMTKVIVTENQSRRKCPEVGKHFTCSKNEDCDKHLESPFASGVITGECLTPFNNTKGYCEISGWCPAEDDTIKIKPMMDVVKFTIFIKNSIRFPLFNVTRGNFISTMTSSDIKKCNYHPEDNPYCPIFLVEDVLNITQQNHTELALQGGEIGINIEWKCNLDWGLDYCLPKYSFTRLDAPFVKNAVSRGYNFRFAKYFMSENGTEFRTLHKTFAIRFDVMVTGSAGKFNTVQTLIHLVAAFTSVGLGTVLCDIILLNFLKGADQYKAKKFEEVSMAQIEASLGQSPDSQLSLKQGIKSSCDSGAISLANSDQPI